MHRSHHKKPGSAFDFEEAFIEQECWYRVCLRPVRAHSAEDAVIAALDFTRAQARLSRGLDPVTGRLYDPEIDPFATTLDLEPVDDDVPPVA